MKKILFLALTALAVTALVLAVAPVGAKAGGETFPTGTYTTTITAEDVTKYGLPSPYPEILIGNWEMTFNEGGEVATRNLTTGQSGQGAYFANQTVLIFGKDSGELDCFSTAYAVYKWSMNGNTLTLTAASDRSDRCWGRFIISTSHPLVKKP